MRATLLALLVAAEVAAAPRVLNRLGPYPRLDRRDRLSFTASPYTETLLSPSYVLPGGECANQTLATGNGTSVTWQRASTAWCSKSDGYLSEVSNDFPRLRLINGAPFLLSEPSATNNALYSRTFSNAVWVKTNMSCAAQLGVGTSGQGSRCTSSAANATVVQTGTYGGGALTRVVSVYVRLVTASSVELSTDGVTWTALGSSQCRNVSNFAAAAPNSSTWVRCDATVAVTAWTIGLRTPQSGVSFDADFAQIETMTNNEPTEPIETAGTATTRQGDFGFFVSTSLVSNTAGCMRMDFIPKFTAVPPGLYIRHFSRGASYNMAIAQAGDNYGAFDAVTLVTVAAAYTQYVKKSYATRWDDAANIMQVDNLTSGASSTAAYGSWGASNAYYLGAAPGPLYQSHGYIGNFGFSPSYSGCTL